MPDLAAQRVLVGDKVAAAKFGTDRPIDDPARGQQILDSVAARSVESGLDPGATVRFFRAQIEANKVVQRGLYALWTQHPELRPTPRPDLVNEVRPELDRITTALLEELRATVKIRDATVKCRSLLLGAKTTVVIRHRLDALHRRALITALTPVCEENGDGR
jgi:chorismate mutase